MKFDVKKKTNELHNTLRVEIEMVHGDGDLYQKIVLGPYKEEESYVVIGILKALEEMKASDAKTNNQKEYNQCPHFVRFLKNVWKYDIFTYHDSWRYYAFVGDHTVFYVDENGVEYEIENLQAEGESKKHYYFKLDTVPRNFTFFSEWDVITTVEPLDDKTIEQWRLIPLEDGEAFMSGFTYNEQEIDPDYLEDDERYCLITGHFEVKIETEEQEMDMWDRYDELKEKATFDTN